MVVVVDEEEKTGGGRLIEASNCSSSRVADVPAAE